MANFLDFVVTGALLGGVYGILAIPLSMVWRATGVLDMNMGGYAAVAGIVAADVGGLTGALSGLGIAVALSAVTVGFYFLYNAVHEGADPMGMTIGTFGMLIAITAGIVTWLGTRGRYVDFLGGAWRVGEVILTRSYVLSFAVALVLLAVVVSVLGFTSVGLRMRSSAQKPEAAELLGVPVRAMQAGAFLVGGVTAGAVGLMTVSTLGLSFTSAVNFTLIALSAALLFGLRGPATTFAGGVAIGVFEGLSRGFLGGAFATAMPSILILLVLASGIPTRGTALEVRP